MKLYYRPIANKTEIKNSGIDVIRNLEYYIGDLPLKLTVDDLNRLNKLAEANIGKPNPYVILIEAIKLYGAILIEEDDY